MAVTRVAFSASISLRRYSCFSFLHFFVVFHVSLLSLVGPMCLTVLKTSHLSSSLLCLCLTVLETSHLSSCLLCLCSTVLKTSHLSSCLLRSDFAW